MRMRSSNLTLVKYQVWHQLCLQETMAQTQANIQTNEKSNIGHLCTILFKIYLLVKDVTFPPPPVFLGFRYNHPKRLYDQSGKGWKAGPNGRRSGSVLE